ncbi:MAG: methylglyoxal synthase [Bacillota bacterium]|nr:methylglyoxal synthase [Bacillota bacterium]
MTETIMEKQKTIALIAHDHQKDDLVEWCVKNQENLKQHFLCGTGTTSRLIAEATGLPVKSYKSGPLGGDQQIGARITEGEIDMMIFFWDPLESQPHDPDIRALLRIAVVYDIPVATNRATADFLITSRYMNDRYSHQLPDFESVVSRETEKILKSER